MSEAGSTSSFDEMFISAGSVLEGPPPAYDLDDRDISRSATVTSTVEPQKSTLRDFLPVFPSKVTSLIFLYACQLDVDPLMTALEATGNPRWRRKFYPLWLGHVCNYWRTLAWSIPDIWTTIIIRISPSLENIRIQGDLLEEWLRRTGEKMLSIYLEELHITALEDEERNNTVNALLATLIQHTPRWRTIDFHLPFQRYRYLSPQKSTPGSPITPTRNVSMQRESGPTVDSNSSVGDSPDPDTLSLSLSQLQNASLHDSQNIIRSELPINLSNASSLQSLSLSYIMTKPDLFLHFPTEQITKLTLTQVLRIVPRHLFEQFPLLHELTLAGCSVVRKLEADANSRTITHSNLKVLHISVESEFLFNMLVHQLAFPALESFDLHVAQPLKCTNFLLSFIRQSKCVLRQLTIESSITMDYDLAEFLALEGIGQAITELHVYDHDVLNPDRLKEIKRNKAKGPLPGLGNRFFERFHPYAYPAFLPNLEVFEYRGLLAVEEINFLEGLILRSRVRERDFSTENSNSHYTGENWEEEETSIMIPQPEQVGAVGPDWMAILRRVEIRAEDVYGLDMITEYADAEYVWEVIRMVEEGILVLVDRAGRPWM